MGNDIYIYIGYLVVWLFKFVLVPIVVAISARVLADRLLNPQPERQRKKRSYKNRFK